MKLTREALVAKAKEDLSKRLGVLSSSIELVSIEDRDFPDSSLGAPTEDEMAAQIITKGWQIKLKAENEVYEYRADDYHLRLCGFQGANHVVD
ncbi:MAG: hypothetical protein N2Z23_04130 [Pyrinomonadaceae bacterium]|nr:hypothetical protein [Pyrinomonadaceae bacterium]MCX7639611.1 hypothetical protein [Pyrinomonadaceae bacterium]MDW8303371.1 hypothetical protein [Acidobacteriota bacterium]